MAKRLASIFRSLQQRLLSFGKKHESAEQKEEKTDEKKNKISILFFAILFLSAIFFFFLYTFGFSYLLLVIYLGALAFIALWSYLRLESIGIVLISLILASFVTLAIWAGGRNKGEEEKPGQLYKDSTYFKQTEQVRTAPDGTVLYDKTIEAVYISVPVQNATNPIEMRSIVDWVYQYIDKEPLTALRYYNDIIELFEKDAFHFKVHPDYIRERLSETYEWEELEKMSEEKLYRLWSKDPENELIYYRLHREYVSLIADAYINRGVVHDRLGYPEKAIEDYSKGDGLSSSPQRYSNYAMAYAHMHDYEKALRILDLPFTLHVRSEESPSELYFYKGYILLQMENNEEARSCFEKAVELDAENDEALNYLGILNYREGQLEQAIDAFSKAINVETQWMTERQDITDDVKHIYYRRALPYYQNRALTYRALGQLENAQADEAIVNLATAKE